MFELRSDPGEADGDPTGALLQSLLDSPPGPNAIGTLADIDPASLSDLGQLLLVQAWERQARWLAARQAAAVAVVKGSPLGQGDDDWAQEDIAIALRLSPSAAYTQLDVSRRLAGPLAATEAALNGGDISARHATILATETSRLDDDLSQQVERAVLPTAHRKTPGEFRRAVRRAIAAADAMGFEVAHAAAAAGRMVRKWPELDGMACLEVLLPADGVEVVYTALSAGAAALGSADARGMDARRADVLVGWARAALEDPALPTSHRRRPNIQVTIDLPTLLGLAEHPAELAGYGPIPASVGRRLAADGEWRRLVTDPTSGALLDYGRRSYSPPAALVDFLVARDGTCRFPGCPRPAVACDLDHGVAWDDGGGTDRDNLGPLCRRHHRLKTIAGWTLERRPDASVRWTNPAGMSYDVPAPRVPPDG